METFKSDVLIIGAGVVGLSVAAQAVRAKRTVIVVERNAKFGMETSSRNSEVIHGGMYYPTGSLKARLCVEGRHLLYDLCERYGIACRKLGKFIVATNKNQIPQLETILEQGRANGVEGLRVMSQREVTRREPNIHAAAALESVETGIIDSHGLMKYYLATAAANKDMHLFCNSKVVRIDQCTRGFSVEILDSVSRVHSVIETRVLVNAAGLASDEIAEMAGMNVDAHGRRLHLWKGEYFSVREHRDWVNHLIYPVPEAHTTGLGIHVTIDLQGCLRLGPNAIYLPDRVIDYTVNPKHRITFWRAVSSYMRGIRKNDVEVGMVGIRPKLQKPGDPSRDFIIAHETDLGFEGLINLIGIESPGLTASPAIGKMVGEMIDEVLA